MHRKILERKLLNMVEEDLGFYDITAAFTPDKNVQAEIIVKEKKPCVIAGICELSTLFDLFNIKIKNKKEDGTVVNAGEIIFEVEGNSNDILCVERLALNILGIMSGIATLTKDIVDKVHDINPNVQIAATRKTTPLFRYFEKKAVMVGGGDPHRSGMDDCTLIKDNHLKLFGSVKEALESAKKQTSFTHKIEIEVNSVEDALVAAQSRADIVMLDNMAIDAMGETISLLNEKGLRESVIIEASGGITGDNIQQYAPLEIDIISMGSLTHSARAMDFSLMIK